MESEQERIESVLGDGLLRMKWSPIAKLLSLPERKLALYLIGSVWFDGASCCLTLVW